MTDTEAQIHDFSKAKFCEQHQSIFVQHKEQFIEIIVLKFTYKNETSGVKSRKSAQTFFFILVRQIIEVGYLLNNIKCQGW